VPSVPAYLNACFRPVFSTPSVEEDIFLQKCALLLTYPEYIYKRLREIEISDNAEERVKTMFRDIIPEPNSDKPYLRASKDKDDPLSKHLSLKEMFGKTLDLKDHSIGAIWHTNNDYDVTDEIVDQEKKSRRMQQQELKTFLPKKIHRLSSDFSNLKTTMIDTTLSDNNATVDMIKDQWDKIKKTEFQLRQIQMIYTAWKTTDHFPALTNLCLNMLLPIFPRLKNSINDLGVDSKSTKPLHAVVIELQKHITTKLKIPLRPRQNMKTLFKNYYEKTNACPVGDELSLTTLFKHICNESNDHQCYVSEYLEKFIDNKDLDMEAEWEPFLKARKKKEGNELSDEDEEDDDTESDEDEEKEAEGRTLRSSKKVTEEGEQKKKKRKPQTDNITPRSAKKKKTP
jgi:hypothetical protein